MYGITVIKRDGTKTLFDFSKISKMYEECVEGLDIPHDIFWKEFRFAIYDGIKTKDIQQALIQTANKLSIENPEKIKAYSILAGRFLTKDFLKTIRTIRGLDKTDKWGFFKDGHHWVEHLEKYCKKGVYNNYLLVLSENFPDELAGLYEEAKSLAIEDGKIFNWNDFYYQVHKTINSYIAKHNNQPVETFAEMLLLIAINGFGIENKEKLLEFYRLLLKRAVVPATPILSNLRLANASYSSCNILDIKDNLESIFYSIWQIAEISKRGGGIGVYLGRIRPSGSIFRGNYGFTNSVMSWIKIIDDTLSAVDQCGKRKGSATVAVPVWHIDLLDVIACRNPIGEIRIKTFNVYPQVVVNDEFMKRVRDNKEWYLFDHHELKLKLGVDVNEVSDFEFSLIYPSIAKLCEEGKIRCKKFKAREIYRQIIKNVLSTGMPYIFFTGNVERTSFFKEKIFCGNLCMENFSPFNNSNPEGKYPSDGISDDNLGYVHSCNLISLNLPILDELGVFENKELLRNVCRLVVDFMNKVISLSTSDSPIKEISRHQNDYATLGIGFIGFADLLVRRTIKENRNYSYLLSSTPQTKDLIRKTIGQIKFWTVYASIEYAKELIEEDEKLFKEYGTKIGYKKLFLERTNKIGFYNLIDHTARIALDKEDAENLKKLAEQTGCIANTMFLNVPPNTSTAIYAGATANVFPPFYQVQIEKQAKGTFIVFPRYFEEAPLLYRAYSTYSPEEVLEMIDFVAELYKYIDSGISFEYPINLRDGYITKDEVGTFLAKFFYKAWEKGIKTLYYARIVAKKFESLKEECVSCAN